MIADHQTRSGKTSAARAPNLPSRLALADLIACHRAKDNGDDAEQTIAPEERQNERGDGQTISGRSRHRHVLRLSILLRSNTAAEVDHPRDFPVLSDQIKVSMIRLSAPATVPVSPLLALGRSGGKINQSHPRQTRGTE